MKEFIQVFMVTSSFIGMAIYVMFNGYPEPFGFYAGIIVTATALVITLNEIRKEINHE